MSTTTLGTIISNLKEDIMELIKVKMQVLRLEIFEKTSIAASFLIYGLIIINLVFFALLFAFMALGFLFGDLIHSVAGGFGIVVFIYLLLLAALILCRKSILTGFQNSFLKEMDADLTNDENNDEKN
jgi:uncharacterized membrane protein YqjE